MSEVESGIRIRTEDGDLPALTGPVLDGLHDVGAGERPYLEVARGVDDWILTRLLPDAMFRLTHRRGADDDEYELYTADPTLVCDIVFAWIDGDPWCYDGVPWARVDPTVAELESVRGELAGLLDGFDVFDTLTSALDGALARAGELFAGADDDFAARLSGDAAPVADASEDGDFAARASEAVDGSDAASDGAAGDGEVCANPSMRAAASADDDAELLARLEALLAMDPDDFDPEFDR
ncbi:hypothetical protein [Nocardia arizonensis]|uniref:hypothetical protein n=1 Tax=Nocardia arizonensis TaxID=1141647 RepID=UPI0006CF4D86|nr:hypothetical protein [Nocardia arizonensis]